VHNQLTNPFIYHHFNRKEIQQSSPFTSLLDFQHVNHPKVLVNSQHYSHQKNQLYSHILNHLLSQASNPHFSHQSSRVANLTHYRLHNLNSNQRNSLQYHQVYNLQKVLPNNHCSYPHLSQHCSLIFLQPSSQQNSRLRRRQNDQHSHREIIHLGNLLYNLQGNQLFSRFLNHQINQQSTHRALQLHNQRIFRVYNPSRGLLNFQANNQHGSQVVYRHYNRLGNQQCNRLRNQQGHQASSQVSIHYAVPVLSPVDNPHLSHLSDLD